jgi:hypothetical protein
MSRSYTSSPPSVSMACRGTALLTLLKIKNTDIKYGKCLVLFSKSVLHCYLRTGILGLNININNFHIIVNLGLSLCTNSLNKFFKNKALTKSSHISKLQWIIPKLLILHVFTYPNLFANGLRIILLTEAVRYSETSANKYISYYTVQHSKRRPSSTYLFLNLYKYGDNNGDTENTNQSKAVPLLLRRRQWGEEV